MDGIGSIFPGMNVHLGTRSRDICVSFHGSLSFESYGRIPEIYVDLYAEALRWKLGHAPLNFLKLGPEILTRDLNQAKKKSGSETQKKQKTMHFSPPQSSAEILGPP